MVKEFQKKVLKKSEEKDVAEEYKTAWKQLSSDMKKDAID
jgi:hypothetical protein